MDNKLHRKTFFIAKLIFEKLKIESRLREIERKMEWRTFFVQLNHIEHKLKEIKNLLILKGQVKMRI
jgi:hypothetical protein